MVIDRPRPGSVPQLRQLWQLAFGDTEEFLDLFFSTAYSPDRCRCVTEDGQVTAALYWFDCSCNGQKMAYLYAVATHPDHRGKGLCRALMASCHRHFSAQGYAGSLLVPQEDGLRRMYRAMGYRDCTAISEFSCPAGDIPTPLRSISQEEYARLRRDFLPENSLLQEGENLDFLEKQAAFYTGPHFLLAAAAEADSLYGLELLGDPGAAPGILKALNRIHGTFRIPGKEIPFAMYHPLSPNAPAPAYFGLAFD